MALQSTTRRAAAALAMLLMPLCVHAQKSAGTEGLATASQRAPTGTLSPLSLPTESLPWASATLPFNTSFRIDGGTAPYRIVQSGDLPDGVLYQPGFNVVTLSGVPSTAGTFTSEFTIIDANGAQATRAYTFNVRPYGSGSPAVIGVSEVLHTADTVNVFFPAVVNVNESLKTTDSILDLGSARILFTETLHTTDTVNVFFAAVLSVAETLHTTDTVSVGTKVGITPATAPAGAYNTAYSQVFTAVGNTGAVTLTPSGTIPGLSFSTSGTSSTTTLSGTPTTPGTYSFTITAHDTVNTDVVSYTLTINKASQSITVGTLPSPVYGGANFTLTATASPSGLPVTIVSTSALATGTGPFTPAGAGSATFQATQAGNANYTAATPVNFNVTIAKALLQVNATPATRAFDQPNPSFGYGITGYVNGDPSSVVSGAPTVATAATPLSSVSGSPYSITPTLGTLSATNYTFNFTAGPLTITAAPQTITFYPLPTLTNGSSFPLTARSSSGLSVAYAVSGPAGIINNVLSVTGSGLVRVTASQTGNGNYSAATSIVRSFTAP